VQVVSLILFTSVTLGITARPFYLHTYIYSVTFGLSASDESTFSSPQVSVGQNVRQAIIAQDVCVTLRFLSLR
jgi:hypothetical protein